MSDSPVDHSEAARESKLRSESPNDGWQVSFPDRRNGRLSSRARYGVKWVEHPTTTETNPSTINHIVIVVKLTVK